MNRERSDQPTGRHPVLGFNRGTEQGGQQVQVRSTRKVEHHPPIGSSFKTGEAPDRHRPPALETSNGGSLPEQRGAINVDTLPEAGSHCRHIIRS